MPKEPEAKHRLGPQRNPAIDAAVLEATRQLLVDKGYLKPLTARLQLLALRFAVERSQNPDTVIVGAWNDPATWAIGAP